MRTRLIRSIPPCLLALFCLGFNAQTVRAENKEAVDYRLMEWQTKHFHDAEKANLHVATLKQLGCEVRQDAHDGHIDIVYRCPAWRRMSVETHAAAHRWEGWLKSAGFETRHEH